MPSSGAWGPSAGATATNGRAGPRTIVPTVSRALGDGMAKLVDGNSCYSPKRAIEVGKLLEAEGIGHFEEPCPYWEFAQTKEVADALSIDVTGGEQDCEFTAWETMIGMRAVDVVQPDVMYMGGMHAHAAGFARWRKRRACR